MARTIEEINKEYSDAVAKLGAAFYDMHEKLPRNIEELKSKVTALYKEADELKSVPASPETTEVSG